MQFVDFESLCSPMRGHVIAPTIVVKIMSPVENTDDYLRALVESRFGVSPGALSYDTSFNDDLGADSLELVSLIMEIEDELDIDIPDEDAAHLVTVRHLMDYVAFAAAAKEMPPVHQVEEFYKRAVGHH